MKNFDRIALFPTLIAVLCTFLYSSGFWLAALFINIDYANEVFFSNLPPHFDEVVVGVYITCLLWGVLIWIIQLISQWRD